MSGFAGVFQLDGAPVDRRWLETMADFLAFRGPDGSQVWISGSAGLCHTLLRTRAETDGRPQITSLDGNSWIAGDVRIDDRETLFAKLPVDSQILKQASSAEIVLYAYAQWGEVCVDHLLGDFSFVIWDARHKRIFGARDHLGVKPFFYAQVGRCLLVSNTLDCILQIKLVPDKLDERVIGDFLIFGENMNPAATFFTAIRRLVVAHRLIGGASGLKTERYWSLPIEEPVYYKRAGDYVDHFNELLLSAVGDRLPDIPTGLLMSGGLDSPALAVAAVQLGATPTAYTFVYDRLIPDEERHFSRLVAQHLRIPIRYIVKDDEPFGWKPGSVPIHTPEPTGTPLGIIADQQAFREISSHTRAVFYGYGPDPALIYEWKPYLAWLVKNHKWGRFCAALISDVVASPRVPVLSRLPQIWRQRQNRNSDLYIPSFPRWLNKEFEVRLRLTARWNEIREEAGSTHQIRPMAHSCFAGDFPIDAGFDAGLTGVPAEFLYPFVDLRVIAFLLTVPTVPWCREKLLIRTALRGRIPEAVRLRPKSPLRGFPYVQRAQGSEAPELPTTLELGCYIEPEKLPEWPGRNREELDQAMRVIGLHYWLLGL